MRWCMCLPRVHGSFGLRESGSPAFDGRAEVGELEHQVHQARVEPVEENLAVDWARRA